MQTVTLYSADWCPFCNRAKALLKSKNVEYTEINVDQHPGKREEVMKQTGMRTIPQIFIGDHFVGGFTDLAELESKGELDKLLSK